MNSIGKECNELKAKYDECFHVWFSEKFLKGDTNDDMCKPIFAVYRDCVRNAIKANNIDLKEVDRDVLGTIDEKIAPESPQKQQ
jgi:TRIAP1/MDM35 family protein